MTKRRREMRQKKASRHVRILESQGKMVSGVEVPPGAIPANIVEQAASCFSRRYYYKDRPFTCVDCGTEETWTAAEQKWYFETIKAHPASNARHCTLCRKSMRAANTRRCSCCRYRTSPADFTLLSSALAIPYVRKCSGWKIILANAPGLLFLSYVALAVAWDAFKT